MQQTRVVIAALAITIGITAPQLAHAGKVPAVLANLPDDTAMFGSIDVKKLAAAPIAADALAMIKQKAADELAKVGALGIDVDKDVSRIYVALAGAGMMDADKARLKIVIAEGNIKIDAKAVKDPVKTHEGITYWSSTDVDYAVVAKRLYLVSDGHMPDLIDVLKGKVKNAAKGANAKQLRAAITATTTTNEGWIVGVVSAADRAAMGAQANDMAWFSAGAALKASAVDFAIRFGMASATAAKTMVDAVGGQLDVARSSMGSMGLGDLGKSLAVVANGATVSVNATMTKQEMGVIAGLVSMMAPKKDAAMAAPAPTPSPSPSGSVKPSGKTP